MVKGKRIVALVPLRGGSKSIPRKNIRPIAGKPLCGWILEALLDVKEIDEVYISTDDDEIAKVAQTISSEVHILKRPIELATDDASTESVMFHFADQVDFDVLITAQATSPLTTQQDINRGLDIFFKGGYDSLLTGVREKRFYWTDKGRTASPVNYDYRERPRRQDFEGWVMENGAFYITTRSILLETQCRLGGKIGMLEMDQKTGVEIDELSDWEVVESLLLQQKKHFLMKYVRNIRLLVVDVDGTLTDAGMYYSKDGEALKKFNTRDAKGLELIRKEGIMVSIMTSEDSDIVKARAEKLQIEHVFTGVKDKIVVLERICKELDVKMSEIAFIGDDLNDLSCIKNVGLGVCPADAVGEVKENALYVCRNEGGKGAVRELCDILRSRENLVDL